MEVFIEVLSWLNSNSGALSAILTLVYVVATIFICVFNFNSAKESRNQVMEMRLQYEESTRARIIPKLEFLEGQLACLVFQNVGQSFANDIIIDVADDWLTILESIDERINTLHTANTLRKLKTTPVFLPQSEKYMYSLCAAADGTDNLVKLLETPLNVAISYKSGVKSYSESFTLSFEGNGYLINTSDYLRIEQKKRNALDSIASSVKTIAKNTTPEKSDKTL